MFWLGVILSLIGGLWIVVNAFRTSVLWGLGSLLVPFVSLIFAIMNFGENKIPLILSVIGAVLVFMGFGSYAEQNAAMQAAAGVAQ
ncbi:MAG TPA: hypothetical protein VGQ93_11455 [Lysobacter sp.]|jgi:hypothetical protein|nr:hypothetical protein [Lysobacter sp.]